MSTEKSESRKLSRGSVVAITAIVVGVLLYFYVSRILLLQKVSSTNEIIQKRLLPILECTMECQKTEKEPQECSNGCTTAVMKGASAKEGRELQNVINELKKTGKRLYGL